MFGFFFILILTGLLSLLASGYVKSRLARYSRVRSSNGSTGAEVAHQILQASRIYDVEIQEGDGMLGDHYNPLNKRLVLSSEIFHGDSLAAIGVAAHECGHALQHQMGYAPLKLRMAAVGVTTFANSAINYLFLFGMLTGFLATYTGVALMAVCWGVVMLFNLITLPVEYDASRRAKVLLEGMGLTAGVQENVGVAKVLNAAALTYVAAFIGSLLYFLYFFLPLLTGRSDD